ncbi:sulfotransferase family protein [Oceanicola sp. D3]|uniref:sulfotransferase family 2 domain-containing protein n=1 Tax=Oceanicola sp. D3 TaxID=2587163 RepID=UPI0011236296|nr:sulfotransferase family 2 domain-containing protein [Oceanicola sp. D3]QDC11296.1 sulfotransferase family protein [Oceanicola sp. D3]
MVIISHSKKFIFFSNPKTGSESVRDMLNEYNEEPVGVYRTRSRETPFYSHMSPRDTQKVFRERGLNFDSYFKFTFVRNPYRRLVSLYEMIIEVDGVEKMKRRLGFQPVAFSRWLRGIDTKGHGGGGRRHQKWRQYGTWSIDAWEAGANGRPAVDEVIKLEDIKEKLPDLFQRIGVELRDSITHNNRRVAKDPLDYYKPKDIELVRQKYQSDLTRFRYEFGNAEDLKA